MMNIRQRIWSMGKAAAAAMIATSVLVLAACGASGGETETSQVPSGQQPAPQQEQDAGHTVGAGEAVNAGQSGIGNAAGGTAGAGSAPKQVTAGDGADSGSEADSEAIKLRKAYVLLIYKLAKQGKMANAGEFIVGTTLIDEVHEAWGEPNRSEGGYDFYSPGMMKGTIAFGIGRGDVVKEIRIFGTALDPIKDGVKLKVSDVQNAIGKPSTVRTTGDQNILVYKLDSYELKFVYTPDGSNDVELDHINVVSPKAAKPMGAD